jgi:hypothetical protein
MPICIPPLNLLHNCTIVTYPTLLLFVFNFHTVAYPVRVLIRLVERATRFLTTGSEGTRVRQYSHATVRADSCDAGSCNTLRGFSFEPSIKWMLGVLCSTLS